MKILLINHYAGSPDMGMEFRPYYFAIEWLKMGHQVKIAAGDFSHLRIKNPRIDKDFQTEMIEGISYCWLKTGDYKSNGTRRALSMFRFVGKLWLNAGKIARDWKPDVVIASSTYPLDTYAARKIAKKSGAKLIHEVHDMWPLSVIELGGMKRTHPFVHLMQMAENSFCKHSDFVVSLLPCAKEYFIQHGMKPEKFIHVANGIVEEAWEAPTDIPGEHKVLLERLKKEKKFILCFFGSHTNGYSLDKLIQAVKNINSDDICAVFVGNGTYKEELRTMAAKLKSNVFFCDPVPKKAVPSLLSYADALYVGATSGKLTQFGICMNKLFDSMMSGKPILYSVDAPNNYIEEYKCGVSVKPGDVSALEEGIRSLYQMEEKERTKLGQNGKKAVLEHFTNKKLAEKFATLF